MGSVFDILLLCTFCFSLMNLGLFFNLIQAEMEVSALLLFYMVFRKLFLELYNLYCWRTLLYWPYKCFSPLDICDCFFLRHGVGRFFGIV